MDYQLEQVSQEPVVNIAIDTLKRHKQALIFCNSKRSAQKTAADIAKETGKETNKPKTAAASIPADNHSEHKPSEQLLTHHEQLKELAKKILDALPTPTDQCQKLAHGIERGVAFHHAGLSTSQREDIENAFRAGTLKLICCTPTLAAGLDMPAFRTVLKELRRYSGSFGMQYIPVLEYQQMAGRAGRPGKEDFGEAIMIASTDKERQNLIDTYIHGEVEDIYSKLAVEPVLRTYVLSLVATGLCRSRHDLVTFFSQTFWAHHYKDMPQMERIITRVIKLLINYEFVFDANAKKNMEKNAADTLAKSSDKSSNAKLRQSIGIEFESAADLIAETNQVLGVTPLGQRVSQLYIDPLSANHLLKGMKSEKMTEFGLFTLLNQTLEMRPLLRAKSSELDNINQFLFTNEQDLLIPVPTMYDLEYEDFFNALKTTQYVIDWINEFDENQLFEKYNIRPGEINAKNDILDWLLYCCSELTSVINKKQHIGFIAKLRTRLQYGAKEELLPLLVLKGVGRVRARKLIHANIRTIAELKSVDIGKLGIIVGPAIAADLKTQVGAGVPKNEKKERLAWQQELL